MIREKHGRLIKLPSGSDILLLSACCLFLISMGEPFLKGTFSYSNSCARIPEDPNPPRCKPTPVPSYYWSFQAVLSPNSGAIQFSSHWFSSFSNIPEFKTQAPSFLIAIFLVQVLTVVSGLLALVLRKRMIRLVPLVSSGIVMLLMNHIYNELATYYGNRIDYQIGYWDIPPSMLLFLLAFTMRFIAGKRKTIDTK